MKISLYYANWCGHCISLKPTWNAFKQELVNNNKDVIVEDFEESVIKRNDINGYPTIMVTDNVGKEIEYKGPRTLAGLKSAVGIQSGGKMGPQQARYRKYRLKYKQLYKQYIQNGGN